MKVIIYVISRSGANTDHLLLDARRYFKQSEIVLFRQAPENMPLAIEQNKQMAVS